MPDLFDRLTQTEVPPPPDQLDRLVHRRLNARLLAGQLVEFAVLAIPHAMYHLGRAMLGVLTDQSPKDPNQT